MKLLYLDCSMGAAGDMLTASLLELLPDPEAFIEELNHLGIPGVRYEKAVSEKCGIRGTSVHVKIHGREEGSDEGHSHHHEDGHEHHNHHGEEGHGHHHSHSHSTLEDITHLVREHLTLPKQVEEHVLAVYRLLAEAESRAHGVPMTEIHFHEVGTMDAIADITAVCLLIDRLAPDRIIASPVHTGSGQVRCAHGILPIPAPATAFLLQGIPASAGPVKGELCTPTGAALLKYFVNSFEAMPLMKIQKIGYGMGKKDFEAANCIRTFLGESEDQTDEVLVLSCNLDDMTAEDAGFAMERLFEGGALEVYTVPVGMKKNRPGLLLRVICAEAEREEVVRRIFRYTTTIGIRETRVRRYVLDREIETLHTELGDVRVKKVTGYGTERMKYEYEDLARIAKERGISLQDVREQIQNRD